MTSRKRFLPAIAFATGMACGVSATSLWFPGDDGSGSGTARVGVDSGNSSSYQPDRPLTSSDSSGGLTTSSAGDVGAVNSDRVAVVHGDCAEQRDAADEADRDDAFWKEASLLDSSLVDERYASAAAVYEREEMRRYHEQILAKEAETTLYGLPPDGYVLGGEEQDALEREIASDPIPGDSVEDERLRQEVFENERRISERYGEQAGGRQEREDE